LPVTKVTSLDALTYAGNLANLQGIREHPRHRFVHGNICDRKLVTELLDEGVDAVINVAAHTHVDRSLLGDDDFVGTNLGGVQVLLEAIKERQGIRFLQVPTDEVYGAQAPGESANESFPLAPKNPYAATKAGGDMVALAYQHSFKLDVVITRCCNNYGPYQYPEKMIPLFLTNLFENKEVPLYGDELHSRQWLRVEDHCVAIARVLDAGRSGEVYNITSGEGMTNLELTERILDILGKDKRWIRHVQDRPGHDRRYALDDTKLRSELGWTHSYAHGEGLQQTVQWYLDHEDWWRPIKPGEYRRYYVQQYGERIRH
jgi:dTDP-glucose 4,6-dehydratase